MMGKIYKWLVLLSKIVLGIILVILLFIWTAMYWIFQSVYFVCDLIIQMVMFPFMYVLVWLCEDNPKEIEMLQKVMKRGK
jgi:anaerobic C4-dicarboxylate transporter